MQGKHKEDVPASNKTQVHPRQVFAEVLADRAGAVIVAHNHPSGNVEPSTEDMGITNQFKSAGGILGIKLLDHIIFNRTGYYSFLERMKFELNSGS
jgi:DNA repair protein RadC